MILLWMLAIRTFHLRQSSFGDPLGDQVAYIWVCLKIGYIPNEIAI